MRFNYLILFSLVLCLTATSCTARLVDFTIISSQNVNIGKPEGKRTTGTQGYILGIGWNIKDALDEAIQSAGSEYDMIVNGVVRYTSYPFYVVVTVEGTAVSSTAMRASMGEIEYNKYLEDNKPMLIDEQEEMRGEE